jgi:hypothetical protein
LQYKEDIVVKKRRSDIACAAVVSQIRRLIYRDFIIDGDFFWIYLVFVKIIITIFDEKLCLGKEFPELLRITVNLWSKSFVSTSGAPY